MLENVRENADQDGGKPNEAVLPGGEAQRKTFFGRLWGVIVSPWWDSVIVFTLFAYTFYVGLGYLNAIDYAHKSKTDWLAPALMVAEGRGMGDPDHKVMKNLSAFINGKAPSWDPKSDPDNVSTTELGWFQRDHKNLIYSAALFWKLFGYNWAAIARLHALFLGISIILAYGIARLVMPKPLAVCVALLFLFSPLHLQLLPEIRDYSKMPFIFGAIFCCGYLVRKPRPLWAVIVVAAVLGAGIGFGLGFRLDMTICIPPALGTLLFLLASPWKRRLWLGPLSALVFLASLYGAGKPSIDTMRSSSSMASHNIHGGLYWGFNPSMGCLPPYYSNLFLFSDCYIYETTSGYYHRVHDPEAPLEFMRPEYFRAGQQYLVEYVKRFPADILLRAIGSVFRMTESVPSDIQKEYGTTPFIERCAYTLSPLLAFLCRYGRYLAVAGVLFATAHQFRWGLFLLAMLLYFCGYPSLQYMPRHYFHLSLVPWWCLGFCVSAVLAAWTSFFRAEWRGKIRLVFSHPGHLLPPALRMAGLAVLAGAGIGAPLYAACIYQENAAREYIPRIAEAPRTPVSLTAEALPKEKKVLLRCEDLFAHPTPAEQKVGVSAAYLAAEFAGPQQQVDFGVRYDTFAFNDFSCAMPLQLTDPAGIAPTWVFFPVYRRFEGHFARPFLGVTLPEKQLALLKGLYVLPAAGEFPFWPTLFLSPGWESLPTRLRLDPGPSPHPGLLWKVLRLRSQVKSSSPAVIGR